MQHLAQAGRHVGAERFDSGDAALAQRLVHLVVAGALDRAPVGERLVEDGGRSPEVDLRRERAPLELLGREVGQLSPERSGLIAVAEGAHLGDAEVSQLDLPQARDEEVGGRHVAVHDVQVHPAGTTRSVGVGEGLQGGQGDVHGEVDREEDLPLAAAGEDQRQIAAVNELHRQVVDLAHHAGLEHLDDVRMLQHRRDIRLAAEEIDGFGVGRQPRREALEGDDVVGTGPGHRARLVDLGHAAPAEQLEDLVLSEAGVAHVRVAPAGATAEGADMSITLRVRRGGRNVALTAPGARLRLVVEEELSRASTLPLPGSA